MHTDIKPSSPLWLIWYKFCVYNKFESTDRKTSLCVWRNEATLHVYINYRNVILLENGVHFALCFWSTQCYYCMWPYKAHTGVQYGTEKLLMEMIFKIILPASISAQESPSENHSVVADSFLPVSSETKSLWLKCWIDQNEGKHVGLDMRVNSVGSMGSLLKGKCIHWLGGRRLFWRKGSGVRRQKLEVTWAFILSSRYF